jgi:hypothetical protein
MIRATHRQVSKKDPYLALNLTAHAILTIPIVPTHTRNKASTRTMHQSFFVEVYDPFRFPKTRWSSEFATVKKGCVQQRETDQYGLSTIYRHSPQIPNMLHFLPTSTTSRSNQKIDLYDVGLVRWNWSSDIKQRITWPYDEQHANHLRLQFQAYSGLL